jgi:predicted GIY-YIG superfamily endonuclease
MNYIYQLIATKYHYIGYTNNPKKRIMQHNKILSGGAKYTNRKLDLIIFNQSGNKNYIYFNSVNDFNFLWNYNWIMLTFLSSKLALSLEWYLKYYLKKNKKNLYKTIDNIINNFNLKKNIKTNIILLSNNIIDYKPNYYNIVYYNNLTKSIIYNICYYFTPLD